MDIKTVLGEAVRRQASDILISAGTPITLHIHGALVPAESGTVLAPEETRDLIYQFLGPEQRREFENQHELDMGFGLDGVSRFRVNVYRQRGTVAAVLRLVPLAIPHYSKIGMPEQLLRTMLNIPGGLVLVTGPTGAGKSTTVASYLEYLNTEHGVPRHVITIEDPIEFPMPSKVCLIDQREIGVDTKGYAQGLRSALRQMPHIIFVGEMRDRETIEIALTAAETGNTVISTLSTQSAAKTINRIIDVFPIQDQAEIRTRLALTLKIVISQVLLPRRDAVGRLAAREVLVVTSPVANMIREAKVHQINNVIASSGSVGMALMDDTLLELYQEGVVHASDIIPRLQDPEKARALLAR
jgi:twitching motility protein PilT